MNEIIAEIRNHVATLLEERTALRARLQQQEEKVSAMREALEAKDARIAQLEEAQKTLKLAKSLSGAGENTEAKLKINELVREIDKCIALLHR
jgi:predicted nuclease with TOPRIM domain